MLYSQVRGFILIPLDYANNDSTEYSSYRIKYNISKNISGTNGIMMEVV